MSFRCQTQKQWGCVFGSGEPLPSGHIFFHPDLHPKDTSLSVPGYTGSAQSKPFRGLYRRSGILTLPWRDITFSCSVLL